MSIDPIEWQAPTEDLSLKAGEIHVWLIHSPAENYLDTAEQARADKLVSPIHQKRFIAAHSGLREILGLYTKQSPREVVFAQTDSGKPFLKKFPEIHFNLSHSEDIALCAISNHPVGIDIEYLNKDIKFLELAKRFFSQSEYEFLKLQNNKNLNLEFLKLWTQKEAYLK
jgi:4'-phosphopantetheinyl transferase